jgi:glucosamine--fructose-6-phosphate aminotransferase (isomerizing)
MYRHVYSQPDAVQDAVSKNRAAVERFAERIAGLDRLYVVGIGTSWHAALMAEHFMRVYAGGMPGYAVHSFDFVHYGPDLTDRDAVVVISHTGRKSYSVEALDRARRAGTSLALVAGEDGAERNADLEHLFVTVPPEGSATYTFSYTSALGVLASLAGAIGRQRGAGSPLDESLLTESLPAAMLAALDTDQHMRELARAYVNRRRIWLSGGGPAGITAMEIALKIKEAAYLMAEGVPTEQMLHGPFQCVDPADLMVLIAPEGPAQRRARDLALETKEIGLDLLVVSDGSWDGPADALATVPPVPEPLSAISTLVPLHLFAYWLAIEQGTNPDRFRLDDERFARAFALATL